ARGTALWTGRGLEPLAEGRAAELLGIEPHAESELARGFRSFAGGMAEIVEALLAELGPAVRTGQGVSGMALCARGWRLSVTGGSAHEVVYAPSITVSLAYRADQITAGLDGTGFVAAPDAGGAVRACSYASRKYPGRAPPGHVLLRA